MSKEFNYEQIDFENCLKEVKEQVKKPNILICGATGAGKSSLVNDIFEIDETQGATVGQEGRPETRGIRQYTTADARVNLFDSEGYEVGDVGTSKTNRYFEAVLSCIEKKQSEYPGQMEKHIHEAWYCVSAANKKFFDIDNDIIHYLADEKKVPTMVLVTKVDEVDEQELDELLSEIHDKIPNINVYTYSTVIPKEETELIEKYVQRNQIIKWAIDNLSESLQLGLIPAIKGTIEEKKTLILKEYVPLYSGVAAAAVLGTSFISVPFSDSVPLMAVQVKMAMSIIDAYGIKTSTGQVITDVVGTSVVSYIGKTLATNIAAVIPVFGTIVKTTVNVSVAASVTAILGSAITLVCEQYLKLCVEKGGADKLPFANFFTKERLSEALNFVKNNMAEFDIDSIISSIVKKKK